MCILFTECPFTIPPPPSSSVVSMVSKIASTSIAMATSTSIYSSSTSIAMATSTSIYSSSITPSITSSSIISLIKPPLISSSSIASTISTTNFSTPLVSSNPTDRTTPPNINKSTGFTSKGKNSLLGHLL